MGEWFSAAELADLHLPDLPTTKRNVNAMAARENWQRPEWFGTHWRRRAGHGGGIEYHMAVLPRWAQVKLAIDGKHADAAAPVSQSDQWAWFEGLPEKKRAAARERVEALDAIAALVRAGVQTVMAVHHVSAELKIAQSTLYRWREATYGLDRADWLPALAPRHAGRVAEAECSPEAWDAIRVDYLRPERPNFSDCYRRLQAMAKARGWSIPSANTLQRRIDAIPVELRTLARDGAEMLKRMYPAQQRLRDHFHALEAVNADGHKWDVFVRWPDGTILRPQMVAIQDLYSGMILAWRVDRSANKEAVRLAIGDMVETYGIPSACWLDNGRDFASKWITGGTPNRYRFKVRDEEPSGILTDLGVQVHWTTPYSGQSKPIERAFRDLAQSAAKHPAFAGAYVGNNIDAKPENYGSTAVPLDLFITTIGEAIAEHNARVGRRSAVCAGRLSFAAAFAASYAKSAIKKATVEQRRLWLLAAEAIRVDTRDGSITLEGNRFWSAELVAHRGQKVTVRFDPQALQQPLHVYQTDGRYIGQAECVAAAGFDDVDAARQHASARKAWLRAQREGLEAERRMSVADYAAMLPAPDEAPPLPETKVVRPFVPRAAGNLARKPDADDETDLDWLERSNAARRARQPLQLVRMEEAGGDD